MSTYWPLEIDLEDTSSPLEILESAKKEWRQNSNGLLHLVIQETQSTDGDDMLIVHANHIPTKRTVALFSVIHRPEQSYPVRIQPKGDELPTYLQKSFYRPGIAEMPGMAKFTGEKKTNKWVCDTPSEFRSKLEEVFNLGSLKSKIISLVSRPSKPEKVS